MFSTPFFDLSMLRSRIHAEIGKIKRKCCRKFMIMHLSPFVLEMMVIISLKVRPHYAVRQNATQCGFVLWQMPKIVSTLMGCGFGTASARHGMLQNAVWRENSIYNVSVSSEVCWANIYHQL